MRRIDLFCKLVSPLVIALIDGFFTKVAILATLGINSASVVGEYALIASVYKAVPPLAHRRAPPSAESDGLANTPQPRSLIGSSGQQNDAACREYADIYLSRCLFTLVVIIDSLSVNLLRWKNGNIPPCRWLLTDIGEPNPSGVDGLRDVCSLAGAMDNEPDWALLVFWTAHAPIWAASGLVGGTALSRIGLWGFDLCSNYHSGRGGAATSRRLLQPQKLLFKISLSSVHMPRRFSSLGQRDFKYPAMMSICAVYITGALYTKFVRDRRGHLFHSSKCMRTRDGSKAIYRQIRDTLG
ncbi:hypothetical protein V494_01183 [Pseudogymnoascus sp. VKM F-4513 (FW-928)]|nr:hypothetical protein V494_01183 [Pseudogymnoascus sp. VKM F-4513 (FW-928)]